MGVFQSLNARVLAFLGRRSQSYKIVRVAFVDQKLVVVLSNGHQHISNWVDLKRVIALRRDLYIGDAVSLLLEFSSASVVEIPETCQGWNALCAAIDSLQKPCCLSDWRVRILTLATGQSIGIWSSAE